VGGCKKSRLLGWSEKNRLLNGVENGPADNIICTVRNDHCLLNTSFESCSPLVIHHVLLELMPCLNQLLSQIDFFCISLGSAVAFLR